MDRQKVPASCKQVVPIGEVAAKQQLVKFKTKRTGEDRTRQRYNVTVSKDGKTATLTDLEHPDYIAYALNKRKNPKYVRILREDYFKRLQNQRKIGINQGKKLGKKEYKQSDEYKALKKKGNKRSDVIKLAKYELRQKELHDKIAALKAK